MRTGRSLGSAAMAAGGLTMSHLALSKPAGVGEAEAGLEGEGQIGMKPHTQIPGVTIGVIRARGQPHSPAEALSHLNHLLKMWHGTCSQLKPRYCPAAVYSKAASRACKEIANCPIPACTCQQKQIASHLLSHKYNVKVACRAQSHSMTSTGFWSTFRKQCLDLMLLQGSEEPVWRYVDPDKVVQGPFTAKEMHLWLESNYLQPELPICGMVCNLHSCVSF